MRIVAVIQARTGSTRLPGKVLLPLCGKPLLERMVERVQASTEINAVVVATTTAAADDPIRDLCSRIAVPVYSGDPTDLLDRHYCAGLEHAADAVAKIPSDCPLIDPAVIDRVVRRFRDHAAHLDYVSNLHPPTWPDGNDVEVMSIDALAQAWYEATVDYEREHTTPYIWDHPGLFRVDNVTWETGRDLSMTHRHTIDYAEDYELIRILYEHLHRDGSVPFSVDDILELLAARPELVQINAHLAGVNWYRDHIGRLRTVRADRTVHA